MNLEGLEYAHVWLVDFEFGAAAGDRPVPICCVAHDAVTGARLRLWEDELRACRMPPYGVGADSLFVAYFASAEFSCHLALGWPLPRQVLDLFVEFRAHTNGRSVPCGNGLLGALAYFGLDALGATEKEDMRTLALRGGPWTSGERQQLLDYCESDVIALARLLPPLLARVSGQPKGIRRALYRGQFMKAIAHMEHLGVPIDTGTLSELRQQWPLLKRRLIERIDADYGVYDDGHFRVRRFAEWLQRESIPWPRLESGVLALDDDTFKEQSRAHPRVAPLRELRAALSQLRLEELAVGMDGRNRTLLSPYRARTGRNQPSNSRFIFGPSVWLRSLIRPEPETGLCLLDYEQQEFGIAAALSGDAAMTEAYSSGDPYLRFGQQAGMIPPDGTKTSHGPLRERFKMVALAVQYGMGPVSLAQRLGQPISYAQALLSLHRQTYRTFWQWSDYDLDLAGLRGWTETVLGWRCRLGRDMNLRAVRNFPMQAHGAEVLRLACCRATAAGLRVLAPVHDAVLIESPLDQLDEAVAQMQQIMIRAGEQILGGFRLRTDAKRIVPPARYEDPRGAVMWRTVRGLLADLAGAGLHTHPCDLGAPTRHPLNYSLTPLLPSFKPQ